MNEEPHMRLSPIVLAIALAHSPTVFATPTSYVLDDLIVTATRLPQPLHDTLQHTTVIDARDIRAANVPDLSSLLRQQAGIEITQSGGLGRQSSLFLRGTNANHVLILLDGIRIGSASTGATAIDQIMLDDIERIEIVRGNVSSVYGSDAIGGVIQLFTRRGQGAPSTELRAGLGEYGARLLSLQHGAEHGNTRYHLAFSQREIDGFSSVRREYLPAVPDPWASFTPADADRDGYRNHTVSLHLDHAYAPEQRLGLSARYSHGRSEYDGAWQNQSRQSLGHLAIHAHNRFHERWQSQLTFAASLDQLDNALDGIATGYVHTQNRQIEWTHAIALAPNQNASLGLSHLQQRLRSDLAYERDQRELLSLSLGYVGQYGPHQLQLNGRHDDYSDFGGHTTGRIGYGLAISPHWKAIASTSSAFRAPSFNELYNLAWGGNPALKPEKARSHEFGMRYSAGSMQAQWLRFDQRIDDLIVYAWPNGNENQERARIEGWEMSLSARLFDYSLKAHLTWQDPINVSTGRPLLRRAKRFASASVQRDYGPFDVLLEWQASGPRPDIHVANFTPITVPGYSVWNLSSRYRLNRSASLDLRIENLFDKNYSLVHGYHTAGRNVFAAFNWRL